MILAQDGNICLEITSGVKSIVPVEPEQGAVQIVRSALADDIDLVCAEAVLGRIGRGLLFELLDRIHRQDNGRGVQSRVRVAGSIQQVIVRRRPGAVDADGIAHPLPHAALLTVSLHRAISNEQQR